jgi:recombination protein RecR
MLLENLISLFAKLPGLGPRSARRVVLHLLRNNDKLLAPLIAALIRTKESIRTCGICGNLDTSDPCPICADTRRDASQICVVEEIADLWAIERGRMFKGRYHVLGGTLSALEGRTPESLNIDALVTRARGEEVREVILATNATVEGQTTAFYLSDRLAGCNVHLSRLAHGIPMGGELDYLDDGTLGAALKARLPVS